MTLAGPLSAASAFSPGAVGGRTITIDLGPPGALPIWTIASWRIVLTQTNPAINLSFGLLGPYKVGLLSLGDVPLSREYLIPTDEELAATPFISKTQASSELDTPFTLGRADGLRAYCFAPGLAPAPFRFQFLLFGTQT